MESKHSPKISRMLADIPRSLSLLMLGITLAVFGILAAVLLIIPSPDGSGSMGSYLLSRLL